MPLIEDKDVSPSRPPRLYSFAMLRGMNQQKIRSRDPWIAGTCALLVHLFIIAVLLWSANHGQGDYRGNLTGHGDGLVVYPMMMAAVKTPSPSTAQTTPSPAANIKASQPEKPAVEQSPVTPIPDPSRSVQQPQSTTSTDASTRQRQQSPAAPQTSQATTSHAPAAASGGGAGNDLLASYQAALRAAIFKTWQGLSKKAYPSGCTIHLSQTPGGAVVASSAAVCGLSREDQLQLEAAALMAQPMPYAGYESVFSTEMDLPL